MCIPAPYFYALKILGESSGPPSADPIAMMEFYMKKAAQEEKRRQPKQSKDEMPPPPSLQGSHLLMNYDFSSFPLGGGSFLF